MLKVFLASTEDGVFIVGHSSALVRIAGKLFLIDPVWKHAPYGKHWTFVPEQVDCDELIGKVDGIILSHGHEDHFCAELLAKFDCPFYVMAGRPSFTNKVLDLKKNAFFLPPHAWVGGGPVQLYFVPHDLNSVDSSCFIRSKDYCVYHGSDNFLSEQTVKKLIADGVAKDGLDVALLPYAFIHWYPSLMKNITEAERRSEAERLNRQSMQQAQSFRNGLCPTRTIAFGSSLFYNHGYRHPLNATLATPFEFGGAAPLFAGDYITKTGIVSQHVDFNQYKKMVNDKLGEQDADPIKIGFPIRGYSLDVVKARVNRAHLKVPGHMLIVNGICINLEDLTVDTAEGLLDRQPYTRFDFDQEVFEDWIDGKITFEQAIGTRRFECTRRPNRYKLAVFEWFNNFL